MWAKVKALRYKELLLLSHEIDLQLSLNNCNKDKAGLQIWLHYMRAALTSMVSAGAYL